MKYEINLEETEKFKKFLEMTPEQFDDYMCKTYPVQFDQRHLPMNQTCMCWGFNIRQGWYYYLDELCKILNLIERKTKIRVSWSQIKEKYASGRFYYSTHYGFSEFNKISSTYKIINIIEKILYRIINKIFYRMPKEKIMLWNEIIDKLVTNYEERVGKICEETGKFINKQIYINGWSYALSEEGYLKAFPDRKQNLEEWKKEKEETENIKNAVLSLNDDKYEELKKFLEIVKGDENDNK